MGQAVTQRQVHRLVDHQWDPERIERWLNTLPGRLVCLTWAGVGGLLAVTEVD